MKGLSGDIGDLVRGEIALAKAEIQDNVTRLGTGAGLLGGAGVVGLFALEFVLLAIMFAIVAAGVREWIAALIVAVLLGVVAAVLALNGKKRVSGASVVPTEAIEHLKNDAEMIRNDVRHLRSRS